MNPCHRTIKIHLVPAKVAHVKYRARLTPAERRAAMTWAQRLKRVFGIDIEICPACGGAMRIIAYIEDPVVIEKIFAHLDATRDCCGTKRRFILPIS